jgi:hypothetical protein
MLPLLFAAGFLATTAICQPLGSDDAPVCIGLAECPDFPQPYANGDYPTSYEYSGKFPEGFVWGVGTASYQVEGAYNQVIFNR